MTKMQLHKLASKIHKWAGITVGLQVFLWLLSGFFMSWFNINDVRGDHLVHHMDDVVVSPSAFNMKALDQFVSTNKRPLKFVRAEGVNGMPVFKVSYMDGGNAILDPQTAQSLSPLNETMIRDMATKMYAGKGEIASVTLKDETGIEYRGPLPVWQVDFNDDEQTSLYFHPDTAKLMSVRSDLWRFFDFMWMLHIMDYDTRDDFNHPLLYIFAFFAVIFALSSFVLAWFRFTKRDFKWVRKT